jgi:two-component system, OmpR family, response regulator
LIDVTHKFEWKLAMPSRILLVEDDEAVASYIIDALEAEGFCVDHTGDGKAGLDLALKRVHAVVILDRMLPGMDGLAILASMRAALVETPALFLSALGTVDDRVEGLTAGSNDYLIKPFAMTELVARVQVLARKLPPIEHAVQHTYDDLVLDRVARTVRRRDQNIDLQPREFRLLEYLMRHVEQTVTRKMLLEGVWDYSFDPGTNVIDVHVSRLRKKLDDGFDQPMLHTVRGAGYRFGAAAE